MCSLFLATLVALYFTLVCRVSSVASRLASMLLWRYKDCLFAGKSSDHLVRTAQGPLGMSFSSSSLSLSSSWCPLFLLALSLSSSLFSSLSSFLSLFFSSRSHLPHSQVLEQGWKSRANNPDCCSVVLSPMDPIPTSRQDPSHLNVAVNCEPCDRCNPFTIFVIFVL